MEELKINNLGQWTLAKSKNYGSTKFADDRPFTHGSKITVNKAVTDKESGKTHGYEVHENKEDGSSVVHRNIPHKHLDQAMHEGKGRLRMGSEKATKKHDLYHSATVHRSTLKTDTGKETYQMTLHPHGAPHTEATNPKDNLKKSNDYQAELVKFHQNGQWSLAKAKDPAQSITTQHGNYHVKSHDTGELEGPEERPVWHHEVSHNGKQAGHITTASEAGVHMYSGHEMNNPKHDKAVNSIVDNLGHKIIKERRKVK